MASELAVVTYDYAAGRQFIKHGENGYLVPFGDKNAFCAQTIEAVHNWKTGANLRKAARATAEKHPWERTIRQFSGLLEEASKLEQNLPHIDIVSDFAEASLLI